MIEGSSFSGLLTRVEIGHIRMGWAGNTEALEPMAGATFSRYDGCPERAGAGDEAVKDAVTVEAVGEFELKGIRRPIAAQNVLAAAPPNG